MFSIHSKTKLYPLIYVHVNSWKDGCQCSLIPANEAETKWQSFHIRHFKCIFLNENYWIPIHISLKFVPKGPIYNIPPLDQIMAWRCPGDKALSETMLVSSRAHICVTRPKWVDGDFSDSRYKVSIVKSALPQDCQWRIWTRHTVANDSGAADLYATQIWSKKGRYE